MATVDAARFLDGDTEFGRVASGHRADLVLVDSNPLNDLSVLRRPGGIMVRGRWYSGLQLKELVAH
jgi:imidazolonepropionase-like amidohydrolase